MRKILTVKNLTYKSILKDIDFSFQENTFYLITGSNKCGKTTLIRILSGLIEVENTYFYQNQDVYHLSSSEFSKIFSSYFYNGSFSFSFETVDSEILYQFDKTSYTVSERKMKYKNLLKVFEFQNKVKEDITNLSHFDKIKLVLLTKVIHTPKVLLLDNILDDLKEQEAVKIMEILKKIGGMTVIISSNTLEISYLFDDIIILDKAKILLSGNPLEVLKEDSLLNKLGLNLPFMVDLSIKIKYYGLVDYIELDIKRMVNKLWK